VLYLLEAKLTQTEHGLVKQALDQVAHRLKTQASELIEAQIGLEWQRLLTIIETDTIESVRQTLEDAGFNVGLTKAVRLIGETADEVKRQKSAANYLVEWNLPENLTMDTYLKRKAEKTPLYAQVPEVSFKRTYVCEDLSKCLCFYEGETEQAIRQARIVVAAPVDGLTRIEKVV